MDEVEQNIVICLWRADQLLAEAEDWGKWLIYEILTNHDILRQPSSIIVLSLDHRVCFFIEYLWEANRSAIFTQERRQKEEKRGFIYAVAKYYSQRNKVGRHCAWADHYLLAVICRSRGELSADEKEENLERMIRSIVFSSGLGEKSHNAFQHDTGPVLFATSKWQPN